MDLEELMTAAPYTIGPEQTVAEALGMMEDLEVRHLPVTERGNLVGLVSDRDLREYRLPLQTRLDNEEVAEDLLDTTVGSMMNSHVIAADVGENIKEAINLMIEYRIGAVPIVNRSSGQLMGIVSYLDLLKVMRGSLDD